MQHPSILHQTLPFHHHILKPFQMVPQIDCHPGRLLTWTASKRWKNPSVTMASWFSSLPTSLIFWNLHFLRCCAINLQLIGIKVSQYHRYNCIYIPFSHIYMVFLKSKNMFLTFSHFWISEATLWIWFSVSTPRVPPTHLLLPWPVPQSKTTRITPCRAFWSVSESIQKSKQHLVVWTWKKLVFLAKKGRTFFGTKWICCSQLHKNWYPKLLANFAPDVSTKRYTNKPSPLPILITTCNA